MSEKTAPLSAEQLAADDELPGMLAVAKSVAEQKWPHTMDAQVWAAEFAKQYQMLWQEEGGAIKDVADVMLGWFANAIMAGYDTASQRLASLQPPAERGATSHTTTVLCAYPSEIAKAREQALEEAAKVCDRNANEHLWPFAGGNLAAAHRDACLRDAASIRALKSQKPDGL